MAAAAGNAWAWAGTAMGARGHCAPTPTAAVGGRAARAGIPPPQYMPGIQLATVLLLHVFAAHAGSTASTRAATDITSSGAATLGLAPRALGGVRLGQVLPRGWMRAQLQAQAAGIAGQSWLGQSGGASGPGGAYLGRANQSVWLGGNFSGADLAEAYP